MKKIIILTFLLFILIINSRADIVEELTLLNNLFKEGIFYGINSDGSIIIKSKSVMEKIYNARIVK